MHYLRVLLTWLIAEGLFVEDALGLRAPDGFLHRKQQSLATRNWVDHAVDPYSFFTSSSTGNSSELAERTGESYTVFLGVKMCFPGYATPDCVSRLHPANAWYTQDCPNLQDPAGITFDINTPQSSLGGKTGCTTFNGVDSISPCAYLCYSHPSYGTAMIPNDIWKNAQIQEHAWAQNSGASGVSDDRSFEHFEGFAQYVDIPSNLGPIKLIEVGSGPWTQTKGLLFRRPDLQVSEVTLFEPAAQWYIDNVATCSYKSGKLQRFQSTAFHDFPVNVIGSGGETLPSHTSKYDALVVMNVIEHVQNAFSFLSGLHHVLKPGGILIFHERFFSSPPSADPLLGTGALHPIRINQHVLDVFLQNFDVLLKNGKPTAGMTARGLGEQGYYFIGRKKL